MAFTSLIVDLVSSDLVSSLVVWERVIVFRFGSFSVARHRYVVGISFSSIFPAVVLKNVLNYVAKV